MSELNENLLMCQKISETDSESLSDDNTYLNMHGNDTTRSWHKPINVATGSEESVLFNEEVNVTIDDTSTDYDSECENSGGTVEQDEKIDYRKQLADWAIIYGIPHYAINRMLEIIMAMSSTGFDIQALPIDARTLLKTQKNKIASSSMQAANNSNGKYSYFGIESGLLQQLEKRHHLLLHRDTINLLINVDGIPLSRCSNIQWTITAFSKNIIFGLSTLRNP